MASLLATLDRALYGVVKGWLDDHRVRVLMRVSAFVAIVVAIVLFAIDPAVPRLGGMSAMQRTVDTALRDGALAFWAANGLFRRARLFLWVDAIVFAPIAAVFIGTLLLRFDSLLRADGTPPAILHVRVPWGLLISLPIAALAVNALDAAVTLYALRVAGPAGAPLSSALHVAVYVASWASVWAWAVAMLAAAWLAVSWFFSTHSALAGGAYERARLRGAVADMLWRSKYAIAILAFYGALLFGMDQTRDALLRQILDIGARPLATLIGWIITIAALLLLARASWYWPRVILRLASADALPVPDPHIEAFAKWWCRILGLVPLLFVAMVLARSMHDVRGDPVVARWLAISIAIIVALAAYYLARVSWRDRSGSAGYYGVATSTQEATRDMSATLTLWVSWGAPVLFLVARFTSLKGWTPSLALPVLTCALAAWAAVFGWLAYQSRRNAAPYILIVVAIVGVLGILDVTDAHRVRAWTDGVGAFGPRELGTLFIGTVAFAVLTAALAWYWSREATAAVGRFASALAWLVAIFIVIKLYDRDPGATANPARPSLEQAMRTWLSQVHADLGRSAGTDRVPVFVVSAEGGGIRSAYWTASVLSRMRAGIDRFDQRTFSIAGVSGGAVGVAVDRGCARNAAGNVQSARQCIDGFGRADLWTQLIGGMMFEDALAMIVPTYRCRNPGCGILGRSYWFEGSMEAAVPALASGVAQVVDANAVEPHVFLTVTSVESGERAIQSDVAIDWRHFPGARDVIALMRADLRLSTAAHNSSRFPYTNPVGAVYGPKCKDEPSRPLRSFLKANEPLCARLQDGGYFDDSATQTTADVLRMLRRCLDDHCNGDEDFAAKATELRARIKPIVVMIRNEAKYDPGQAGELPCAIPSDRTRDPAFPNERDPLKFYPSAISAPVTLYNTRTAHMYAAEAEVELDIAALWSSLGIASSGAPLQCGPVDEWIGTRPVQRFDLTDDGTLYPSGWLMSQQAMLAMCRQAERELPLRNPAPACAPAQR